MLSERGITRADIDIVFMTHLHFDHVGWNFDLDGAPSFPNARYIMSRAEWDARPAQLERATALGQPPYIDRCVTPLEGLGIMDLIDGERDITPELKAIPTPGHSPGHMSVLVTSSGERGIVLGDVLLHPAQVSEPEWSSRMDMDRDQAARTRRAVMDRAEAEHMTMAAGHIRGTPFGRVTRVDGLRYWQGVDSPGD
jgi:glyoxylase-like metal-dependent hydrolase (beta-lactamase superfamily II)